MAHRVMVIQYCACTSPKAKDMRRLRFDTKNLTEDVVTFLGDICKRLPRAKTGVVSPGGRLMLASLFELGLSHCSADSYGAKITFSS